MKMDVNSNKYTFIFSAIMVVVVATVLAIAAESLKPFQQANVRKEKMQNILASCGIEVDRDKAEESYKIHITEELMLDKSGNRITDSDVKPFDIDVLFEFKSGGQRNFPVFICTLDNGEIIYVIPMVGKGLWGPIWGYAAIGSDFNTLVGATFDHKGETPGLGAEINKDDFEKPFTGKQIFDSDGEFMSVKVIKGGADPSDLHGVDAISGGTITSNGVSEMLERTFKAYEPFLKSKMKS